MFEAPLIDKQSLLTSSSYYHHGALIATSHGGTCTNPGGRSVAKDVGDVLRTNSMGVALNIEDEEKLHYMTFVMTTSR